MAIDPEAWSLFGKAMLQQAASTNDAPYIGDQLLFILPSTFGDFALRLAIAAGLVGVAIWRRWAWLAFAALVIAVPTFWVARLAPLVGVPRLYLEDRQSGTTSSASDGHTAPDPPSTRG